MKEEEKKLINGCAALLGAPMLVAAFVFGSAGCWGVTYWKFWAWFVSPTFGCDPVTLPQAIGLAFMLGAVRAKATGKKKDEEKPGLQEIAAHCFLYPFVFLFYGWALHLIIGS